jgi:hypothetical protein
VWRAVVLASVVLLRCSAATPSPDAGGAGDSGTPGDAGASGDAGFTDAGLPDAVATLLAPGPGDFVSPLSGVTLELDVTRAGALRLEVLDDRGTALVERSLAVTVGVQAFALTPAELETSPAGTLTFRLNGVPFVRPFGATFFVAGQSNSANWECAGCDAGDFPVQLTARTWFLKDPLVPVMPDFTQDPLTNVMPPTPLPALGPTEWISYAATTQGIMPIANGRLRGLWPSVMDRLGAPSRRQFRVIATGVGATSVAQWAAPDYLLNRFGYLASANVVDAVLWVQGETDAIGGTSKADYKAQLSGIKASAELQWMKHLPAKPPWVVFLTTGPGCSAPPAGQAEIRAALQELASERPTEFLLGPDFDAIPHVCHFDSPAQFDAAVQASTDRLRELFPKL